MTTQSEEHGTIQSETMSMQSPKEDPISRPPSSVLAKSSITALPPSLESPMIFPNIESENRNESSASSTKDKDVEKAIENLSDQWQPEKKEWFIMISLSIISFLVALDTTILVSVLPQIAQSLHGNSIDAFWAGTSYLLTNAVFQPVIASISNFFGRQQLLLFSLTFFTVGTILCAAANNFTVLLTGRSIQGVGGGGIITLSQVIFCDIVPLRFRPKYFALVLGSWSVGTILGPVLGGVLIENTTWRWVFLINLPICFLGYILAIFFVRLNAVSPITFAQKLCQTDWIGAAIFVGASTTFLIGLSWAGIQYAWTSAQTLVPIIIGIAGIAAFVAWQISVKPKSLLPMSIFYCRSAVFAFYGAMVNGLAIASFLYYIPFYSMSIRAASPTRAGIDLFPSVFFLVPGSIVVAALTTRLGRWRWAVWAGWGVTTLGCGLTLLLGLQTRYVIMAVALAIVGIGLGMVVTSVNVGVQAIVKVEDCAMAASMYGFFRSLGMPIGVSLCGTIFQNAMLNKLDEYRLPHSIAHDSERYIYVLRAMAQEDPMRIQVLESYLEGFRAVFIFVTSVSASALVLSLFIRRFDMNKTLVKKFIARFQVRLFA